MFSGTFRRKYYKGKENPCSTPSAMSKPYCEKCNKQVVWSTLSWKPRLRSCKSYVHKKVCSCKIVTNFNDECRDQEIPFKYLAFVIIDAVKNGFDMTHKDT